MTSESGISPKNIAFYDPQRKGIFIHNDQLKESPFEIGDRFSVRKGKRELFVRQFTLPHDTQELITLIEGCTSTWTEMVEELHYQIS